MVHSTLERRVAQLEQQMDLLLHGRSDDCQPSADAWKTTCGMFRGDPVVQEMIDEARRMREEDRGEARESHETDPV